MDKPLQTKGKPVSVPSKKRGKSREIAAFSSIFSPIRLFLPENRGKSHALLQIFPSQEKLSTFHLDTIPTSWYCCFSEVGNLNEDRRTQIRIRPARIQNQSSQRGPACDSGQRLSGHPR